MLSSFTAEMDKLLRWPATWVLWAVWGGLGVVFAFLFPYFSYTSSGQPGLPERLLPEQLANLISGFPLFGGAIALVLGALVVGSEFGWDTLKMVLVQRPGRLRVWTGKLLALAVLLFTFVLATFVPGALLRFAVAVTVNVPVEGPPVGDLARALGGAWFILTAWAALGAALATLLRGTALAIGLGLIYVLVIEGLIRGFAGQLELIADIATALPGPNAGSLAAALAPTSLQTGTPGLAAAVGGPQAALVLALYAAGFVLLSTLLFLRRDVT